MTQFAYLFERFPSFGQTFCYREVAELARQGVNSPIFAIRNPKNEPPQDWDPRIVERVHYLPDEEQLLREARRASKKGKLTGAKRKSNTNRKDCNTSANSLAAPVPTGRSQARARLPKTVRTTS